MVRFSWFQTLSCHVTNVRFTNSRKHNNFSAQGAASLPSLFRRPAPTATSAGHGRTCSLRRHGHICAAVGTGGNFPTGFCGRGPASGLRFATLASVACFWNGFCFATSIFPSRQDAWGIRPTYGFLGVFHNEIHL